MSENYAAMYAAPNPPNNYPIYSCPSPIVTFYGCPTPPPYEKYVFPDNMGNIEKKLDKIIELLSKKKKK